MLFRSIEKFQGMAATLQKNGVEYQDDYVKWCASSEAYDARSIGRFLKRLPRYTAVVCCNYMIFQLTRQVLEQLGKRVPEDCSLVCFDYSSSDWEAEGVTCSIHQGYRIGQEVAARLMRMIRNRDCDDKGYTHVLPPEIYLGRTVGPARDAR